MLFVCLILHSIKPLERHFHSYTVQMAPSSLQCRNCTDSARGDFVSCSYDCIPVCMGLELSWSCSFHLFSYIYSILFLLLSFKADTFFNLPVYVILPMGRTFAL